MNRTKVNLAFTSANTDRTCYYRVRITGGLLLFVGKCYVMAGTNNITLDLTDIVGNCTYKGYELLTPTWNSDGYYQPYINNQGPRSTVIPTTNLQQHYNPITVTLYSDSGLTNQIATTSKNIYFHSIPFMTESYLYRIGNNDLSYYLDFNLVPRLPNIPTDKIRYGQLVYNQASSNVYWYKGDSQNTVTFFNSNTGSRVLSYRLDGIVNAMAGYTSMEAVHKGTRREILRLDNCIAPYYLIWLNPNGGFQSWPFKPSSLYTEEHTRNMRLTMDEQSWISNHSLSGNWKLKSDLVTDAQYKALLGCTLSPYTILYITELDRAFYVNCTDGKSEYKTYQNQGRKLSIFEVNVKSAEQDFYIV